LNSNVSTSERESEKERERKRKNPPPLLPHEFWWRFWRNVELPRMIL